jgi:hypothetical protein
MPHAGAANADAEARRDRRRAVVRLSLLAGALVMTIGTVYLATLRFGGRDEQKEIHLYFRRSFPPLHAQVKSVQAGLAGLVDETAPSSAGAVATIDENILPTIDWVLEQARPVGAESVDLRALHAGYLQAIEGMRADALRARAVFADTSIDLGEQRKRVYEILLEIRGRFEAWSARAAEVCRQHGIEMVP